jgi:predicted enzyme related to lactoylglutathione lyase
MDPGPGELGGHVMTGRDGYPAGVPCWVDTEQPDPVAATEFYGPLFGWDFDERTAPGSDDRYFIATLDGQMVAAVAPARGDGSGPPPAWNTYIWVDDADESAALVWKEGGTVLLDPVDAGPAGRLAIVTDPTGAPFRLWQAGRNRGAQVVNADNSWNWSNLDTPDPARAAAFYGAVFGWELDTFDLGGSEAMMWRRPGYGDHLAELDPGFRQRQATEGVPDGFADAIGWVNRSAEDEPARWGVTFAVGDTDAVVARAVELGASAVVEPFDAPAVRIAVLADPQGAVFTVNHFDPARLP